MFANLQCYFCVAIQVTRLPSSFEGMIILSNNFFEKSVDLFQTSGFRRRFSFIQLQLMWSDTLFKQFPYTA